MSKKKKMLVVYSSFEYSGGAERLLLNFLNIFPQDEYQIDLSLFDDKQDEGKMFDAVEKHINILPFLRQFSTYSSELMRQLRNGGNDHMADVREFVHSRNENDDFLKLSEGIRHTRNWEELKKICPSFDGYDIAVAFLESLPLKIVAEKVTALKKCAFIHIDYKIHVKNNKGTESYVRSLQPYFEKMDTIISGTEQNVDSFTWVFPNLSSKMKILTDTFDNNMIRKKADEYIPCEYLNEKINILTVARFEQRKGSELILETARKLKDKNISFRWFILGSYSSAAYYKKCVNLRMALDVETEVVFLGVRSNPYPYYKQCNLYVQPSYYEGRCLAIEEARILGCPIIVTNYPSAKDQITNGINGRICEISPDSLSDAIIKLLDDDNERARFAEANADYLGKDMRKYLQYF